MNDHSLFGMLRGGRSGSPNGSTLGAATTPGPLRGSRGEATLPRDVALDLLQLAFDLAGIVDPTPTSDSASALLAIARGQWLDAAISGISIVPYVGDLAKLGRLNRHLKSVRRAIELASQSPVIAKSLIGPFEKIQTALNWLPTQAGRQLESIRGEVAAFLKRHRHSRVSADLPDVSKQFEFKEWHAGGRRYQQASGRLGVPGRVKTARSRADQSALSRQTGDDAGHLIANQFGAPGDLRNLTLQNRVTNRWGTYRDLERKWAELLENGSGIEVVVTDRFRMGKARPYRRDVRWTEIDRHGRRTEFEEPIFANFDSDARRAATNAVE